MHSIVRPRAVALLALAAVIVLEPTTAFGVTPIKTRVKSHNPVVTREVWVTFGRAGYTGASISGATTGIAVGSEALLYAIEFPYHKPLAPIARQALTVTGGNARFGFHIVPRIQTIYQVEVVPSPSSDFLEAQSANLTVFVSSYAIATTHESCSASVCTIHISMTEVIPPKAIPNEKRKHQFLYLDTVPWGGGPAPARTTYHLVHASVSAPQVTGDHLHFRITITYPHPAYRWWWYWESCTKDTVIKDGLGLAGFHHCGARTLSPHILYVG